MTVLILLICALLLSFEAQKCAASSPKRLSIEEKLENVSFFWLNLPQSTKRAKYMTKLFLKYGVEHHRVESIFGDKDDAAKKVSEYCIKKTKILPNSWVPEKKWRPENFILSRSLASISMSHLKAIQNVIFEHKKGNLKKSIAVICEDDLSFSALEYCPYTLESLVADATQTMGDWDVLNFGISNWHDKDLWGSGEHFMPFHRFAYGLIAYVINLESPRIQAINEDTIENIMEKHCHVSEYTIQYPLNSYVSTMPLFLTSNADKGMSTTVSDKRVGDENSKHMKWGIKSLNTWRKLAGLKSPPETPPETKKGKSSSNQHTSQFPHLYVFFLYPLSTFLILFTVMKNRTISLKSNISFICLAFYLITFIENMYLLTRG